MFVNFCKAYRLARRWRAGMMTAAYRSVRYVLTGDSGEFRTAGWSSGRIRRSDFDQRIDD